jgi:D-inositol-3-phosphate glycosyltransferase
MKIVIAAPAWPYRGGIAEFSNRLAVQFQTEGHEVRVITFKLQYPGFLFPGKTQYTGSPAPEKIRITREINSVNPLNWISTGRRIRKDRPDILILRFWLPFMGPCLGTIARIARSNNHTKVICIFDNVIPHEKRTGDKLLTKYFTRYVDGAIVMSSTVEEELRLFNKDIPLKLNPHPLFDNYGEPVSSGNALNSLSLDARYKYILFFGFIRAYKGLDLLIESFADRRLRDIGIKLIVAGEFYEDDAPYRDLIRKYNLENEIILFDRFIKDEEVGLFFSAADLVVQPYKSATQSGVTQIAFHFNKPMLVTDVGGLREIVTDGKCGYVVKPLAAQIAEAILDFFLNNRSVQFTAGVIEEKKKFSWNSMTDAVLSCYNALL